LGAANSSHLLRMGRLIGLHSTWQERPRGGSEHSTHAKAFLVPSRTERHESRTPVEGTSLTLSFYVLLAPIFLWLGFTFLAVRVVLTMSSRRAERGRSKPLPTWRQREALCTQRGGSQPPFSVLAED